MKSMFIFTQPLHHGQNVTKGQFLSGAQLIRIQSFKTTYSAKLAHRPSGRVFTIGAGDWGSIPGQVIPKTQKIVLDTSLHYKVHLSVVAIEKGAFW